MSQNTHAAIVHESVDELNSLLARLQDGTARHEAAYELHRRYSSLVLWHVRRLMARQPAGLRTRLDAEDVAQDAWTVVFVRAAQGAVSFATLHTFLAFLCRTAAYKAREARKHHAAGKRDFRKEVPVEPALAA
jgi:DNA-directed RNA polymerase specialized sigma24 family protein